jgi:hypothetical protein
MCYRQGDRYQTHGRQLKKRQKQKTQSSLCATQSHHRCHNKDGAQTANRARDGSTFELEPDMRVLEDRPAVIIKPTVTASATSIARFAMCFALICPLLAGDRRLHRHSFDADFRPENPNRSCCNSFSPDTGRIVPRMTPPSGRYPSAASTSSRRGCRPWTS